MDPIRNDALVAVSTGYAAGATTIVLTTAEGAKLPDPATEGPFNLVWWNATDYRGPHEDPYKERVRVTARSTDTLTVVRAQEGTSDVNHNTGGKQYMMALAFSKKMYDDINEIFSLMFLGTMDENTAVLALDENVATIQLDEGTR